MESNREPLTNESEQVRPRLLTTEEAAVFLGLSPHTLRKWRQSPTHPLRWLEIGTLKRYEVPELERFIASCRRGGECDAD